MSEAGARDERKAFREQQAEAGRAQQKHQVQTILADIKRNYEGVKALNTPEAKKAILFLRGKIRKIRAQWRDKQLDPKLPHNEKDVLLGQYHAVMLAFELLDQITTMNDQLVPGKEEEYILEKFFKKPQGRQNG